MPEAIAAYLRRTGQAMPGSRASLIRSLLESLALKYRCVIDELGRTLDRPIRRIHVIGGGSRNEILCQFTADATGLMVVAGPAEATAVGNILVQAMALGLISSPVEIRTIIRDSFDLKTYGPDGRGAWDRAFERFHALSVH